jgi:hypothetical protein
MKDPVGAFVPPTTSDSAPPPEEELPPGWEVTVIQGGEREKHMVPMP